jgi:hypothetical protein
LLVLIRSFFLDFSFICNKLFLDLETFSELCLTHSCVENIESTLDLLYLRECLPKLRQSLVDTSDWQLILWVWFKKHWGVESSELWSHYRSCLCWTWPYQHFSTDSDPWLLLRSCIIPYLTSFSMRTLSSYPSLAILTMWTCLVYPTKSSFVHQTNQIEYCLWFKSVSTTFD